MKLPESAPAASRTKLTGETITDTAIRQLQADARASGNVKVAVLCSKALVRLAPGATVVAVLQRRQARSGCAAEMNARAEKWRDGKKWPGDAKYARMQETASQETAQHPNTPGKIGNGPLSRTKKRRKLKYMQCWYCNGRFRFGVQVTVQTRSGVVTVHRSCVADLIKDGLMDAGDAPTCDESAIDRQA
jgi:hypothetical protein